MGRQEWNREVERDRTRLEQILALLVSLAFLADRAASAPRSVRLTMLDALVQGEAAAMALLTSLSQGASVFPAYESVEIVLPESWGTAEDAVLLAATFRMLALALATLLAQTRARSDLRCGDSGAALTLRHPCVASVRVVKSLSAPDTS